MGQTKGRFLLSFTALFFCLEVIATLLMIYAQSLAYFFSEHFKGIDVLIALTILTFISIGTFIATYIVILKAEKKRPDINFFVYLLVNGLYGFFVSLCAIFVLAMWG